MKVQGNIRYRFMLKAIIKGQNIQSIAIGIINIFPINDGNFEQNRVEIANIV